MTCGYRIWIRGEYDISVLSPEIIALLVEKVKKATSKDLIIPVEEIIPRGYAEYLVRVMEANMAAGGPCGVREVYGLTARQIGALNVEAHRCFDRACLCGGDGLGKQDGSGDRHGLCRQDGLSDQYDLSNQHLSSQDGQSNHACLSSRSGPAEFDLRASPLFYMLARREHSNFTYICCCASFL